MEEEDEVNGKQGGDEGADELEEAVEIEGAEEESEEGAKDCDGAEDESSVGKYKPAICPSKFAAVFVIRKKGTWLEVRK